MSDFKDQSKHFLISVVRAFDDEVKLDRADYFRSELRACQADNSETAWNEWCAWQSIDEIVGRVLSKYGDIRDILETIIIEQEQLDKEANEDYHDARREYQEVQG